MILVPEMNIKDMKYWEMFNYILQIVPISSHYATNPGNKPQNKESPSLFNKCITFFKLYPIHQIWILLPEMYINDMKN